MLEWNVDYRFQFNPFYPVDLRLVFAIPTNQKTVYMSLDIEEKFTTFVLLLDTQKFIRAWRVSQDDGYFKGYNTGDPELWRKDRKFHYAEQGFSLGLVNPVPLADISATGRFPNCNISFVDGVTRTIWLLANQAEYFPVSVRNLDEAYAFQQIAGRENCAVYPCEGIYYVWFQQHQHLLPTIPGQTDPNDLHTADNPK